MKNTSFLVIFCALFGVGYALGHNEAPQRKIAVLHSIPLPYWQNWQIPAYISYLSKPLDRNLLATTEKFHRAQDQLNAMNYWLKKGARCDAVDLQGDTLAHKIIKSPRYSSDEKTKALGVLLTKQPSLVSKIGTNKKSLLNLAVDKEDKTLAWLLIYDYDAKPISIQDLDGMVARSLKIRNGNQEITKMLVQAFHEKVVDEHGRTLLHWYAQKGAEDVVEALHNAGAQQVPDSHGYTPWKLALVKLMPRSPKFRKIDEILNGNQDAQEKDQPAVEDSAHSLAPAAQPSNNLVDNDNLNLFADAKHKSLPVREKLSEPKKDFEVLYEYTKEHNIVGKRTVLFSDDLVDAIKAIRAIRKELDIQKSLKLPRKKAGLDCAVESTQSESDFYVKYTRDKATYEFRPVKGLRDIMVCCDVSQDGATHKLGLITQDRYARLCNVIRSGTALSKNDQRDEDSYFWEQAHAIMQTPAVRVLPADQEPSSNNGHKDIHRGGIDSIELVKNHDLPSINSILGEVVERDDFTRAHSVLDKEGSKKKNISEESSKTKTLSPSESELIEELNKWDNDTGPSVEQLPCVKQLPYVEPMPCDYIVPVYKNGFANQLINLYAGHTLPFYKVLQDQKCARSLES